MAVEDMLNSLKTVILLQREIMSLAKKPATKAPAH